MIEMDFSGFYFYFSSQFTLIRIKWQLTTPKLYTGKGDVFGDEFWKIQTIGQSSANVRALTYCDLHTIKRDKLLEVLNFYKAFALSFARNLTLTHNLRRRLVFRKLADLKREKELADRTKDEPQVAANQDHIVRKIFSKFRRQPTTQGSRDSASQSDAEKGETQTERAKVSDRFSCVTYPFDPFDQHNE